LYILFYPTSHLQHPISCHDKQSFADIRKLSTLYIQYKYFVLFNWKWYYMCTFILSFKFIYTACDKYKVKIIKHIYKYNNIWFNIWDEDHVKRYLSMNGVNPVNQWIHETVDIKCYSSKRLLLTLIMFPWDVGVIFCDEFSLFSHCDREWPLKHSVTIVTPSPHTGRVYECRTDSH